jgi:nucleoside-diphosphate-sugar epimerase
MKILVTGGTGFLGRHLVWRLAVLGHQVIFTGRQTNAAKEVISLSSAPVHWIPIQHGEPNAANLMIEAAEGVDAIVHTAALSSPWGQYEDFVKANVESTKEVLAACEKHKIQRLVHISTPSVYFEFKDKVNVKEDSPQPHPINHYVTTKAAAEKLVLASAIPQRIILRPKAIFGPWDQTLMPRILRVIQEGAVPLIRGGNAMLDVTYVDNLVDAIVLSLTQELKKPVAIYNVTNGEPQKLTDLFNALSTEFHLPLKTKKLPWWLVKTLATVLEAWAKIVRGKEPKITRYGAGVLAFSQTLDISAIEKDLGYQPKIKFTAAIKEYSRWYFRKQASSQQEKLSQQEKSAQQEKSS